MLLKYFHANTRHRQNKYSIPSFFNLKNKSKQQRNYILQAIPPILRAYNYLFGCTDERNYFPIIKIFKLPFSLVDQQQKLREINRA